MSIFGSMRGRASSIRLTPQDIELSPKARQDERPPRRRPLYTVVPGESDPIIAQFIADMIEFITPYDRLIPELYQTYTPTVYDNDDEDRLISPLQRWWIRRCIVLEEYDYLPSFEMRCCLHQNFQEQTLKDMGALQEINILVLVDYFKTLAREIQHDFAPRTELELVSIHYRALRGHMFDFPVAFSFTRERSSNDSSTTESSSSLSSTGDAHASGLINESRLAIAPLRPGHIFPIRSRVEVPTQPSKVHLPIRGGAVARPQPVPARQRETYATHPPRLSRGFPLTLGRELFSGAPISYTTPSLPHLTNRTSETERRRRQSRLLPR